MMYALKKEPEERTVKEVEQIKVENISIPAAYQFLKPVKDGIPFICLVQV